jgi:hypothetical protein
LPGSLRTATIRPLSEAATSSHLSIAPEVLTTGAARRTYARVARTRNARMSAH